MAHGHSVAWLVIIASHVVLQPFVVAKSVTCPTRIFSGEPVNFHNGKVRVVVRHWQKFYQNRETMMSANPLAGGDSHLTPASYEIPATVAENIRQALRGLQFGEITITVRNGSVVQIERIARKRQFKSNPHD